MTTITIFVLGSLGALAPEILRLYSLRTTPRRFRWSWFYLVISLIFAALGGVVALVLPATTPWGALYAGLSTPVVISAAAKRGLSSGDDALKSAAAAPSRATFRSFLEAL